MYTRFHGAVLSRANPRSFLLQISVCHVNSDTDSVMNLAWFPRLSFGPSVPPSVSLLACPSLRHTGIDFFTKGISGLSSDKRVKGTGNFKVLRWTNQRRLKEHISRPHITSELCQSCFHGSLFSSDYFIKIAPIDISLSDAFWRSARLLALGLSASCQGSVLDTLLFKFSSWERVGPLVSQSKTCEK